MNTSSPYIGLCSFQTKDADIFFGRDEEINSLLRKLEENRFVAVLGDSGSGKSSLVRAGLIPVLESGIFADTEKGWQIAEMRPGTNPVQHLAGALLKTDWGKDYKKRMEKDVDPEDHLVNDLSTGIASLLELLQEQPLKPQARLLILVDQFEELFGDDDNDKDEKKSEKEQFVRQLLTGVTSKLSRVHVVITMRSDFIGKCAGYDYLPEAINKGFFLVPQMMPLQIIDAIKSPAKIRDAEVEPKLIDYLLGEIEGREAKDRKQNKGIILDDKLPILQHALMQVWNKEEEDGVVSKLRLETFKELVGEGSLKSLLGKHLEEIWKNELDKNEKDLAEILFRELTKTDDRDRNVRRIAKLGEIADVAQVSCRQLAEVVRKFQQPGCDFLRIQPLSHINNLKEDTNIDITHECIIRQWEKLKKWVENEIEKAGQFKRLLKKVDNGNDGHGELLTGIKLDNVISWESYSHPNSNWAKRYEKEYRDARKEEDKDQNKKYPTLENVRQFINDSKRKQKEELQEKLRTAILSADTNTILSLIEKKVRLEPDQVRKLFGNEVFYYALFPKEIILKEQPQRKKFDSKSQAGIEKIFDKSSQEDISLNEKIEEYFIKENIFDSKGNERKLRNKFTVQHYAALNGQTKVLKCLLKLGVDIKAKSEGGSTPFHWSAIGGKEKTMEWLLGQYGGDKASVANMVVEPKEDTALHAASWYGNKAVVQKLLDWKAERDALNIDMVTPLMFAISNNQKETIQLLLDKGSDPNQVYAKTGESVLQLAISFGHAKVFELLYDYGAKYYNNKYVLFNHKDNKKNTPLITALIAISNNVKGIETFTEQLIDDIPEGSDIISKALVYASAVDSTWAKRLLEKGANPNFEDTDKNTPLLIAAAFGKIDCIKLLLEKKVSTDCINKEKQTALHLATRGGYRNAIDLLLESTSIDPNARDRNHETPLHYAARTNCLDIIERLLEEDRIEKEPRNKTWQTPLHIAAIADNTAVVWTLLKSSKSSDVDPKDLNGNTPMVYALNNKDKDKGFRTAVTLRKAEAKLSLWVKEIKNKHEKIIDIEEMNDVDLRSKFACNIQSGTDKDWPFISLIGGSWEDVPTTEAVEALIEVRKGKKFPLGLGVGCSAVAKVRKRKIDFYKNAWLYEGLVLGDKECAGYLTFLKHQRCYTLLDGTSPPIHKMNEELPLQIDTQDRATDYLRFFCASVHGDAGAFRIFEDPTQLLQTEDMSSEEIMRIRKLSVPIKLERANETGKEPGWQTEAVVKYEHTLSRANFSILLSGKVDMLNDTSIATGLNVYREVFNNGLRMLLSPSSHQQVLYKYYIEKDLPLHLAALENQPQEIERLLQKPETDPNKRDKDQSTALHIAAETGSSPVVDQLLENNNIEIDPFNAFGHTPLTLADKTGLDDIVNKLLKKGAKLPLWSETISDTNLQKKEFHWLEGDSLKDKIRNDLESKETEVWPFLPLINGVWEAVPIAEVIEVLIGVRKTIPGFCLGCTSIIAVRKLKVEFYEDAWLYEGQVLSDEKCAGYLTFIQHKHGYTPLDGTSPPIHMMNAILPLQIDTQDRARDYLRFFCASVHCDVALRIFEEPTQLLPTEGMSPEEIMKIEKVSEPIKLERTNETDKEPGWNTEVVVKYRNSLSRTHFFIPLNGTVVMIKDMKIVTGLNVQNEVFRNGLRVLSPSYNDKSLNFFTEADLPLHFAAFRDQPSEIESLLQNPEIDPNKCGIDRSTALHIAAESGSSTAIDQLLENKDIEIDPYNALGHTPLTLAAKTGHDIIVNKLLNKGARLPLWSEIISDSNLQKINWLEDDSLKEKIRKDLESKEADVWPFISLISGCWEDVPTTVAIEVLTEIKKVLPIGLGVGCTAVDKVRKRKIDFYKDSWLYEGLVLSNEKCAGYLTFIQHQYSYTLLDGTSPPIHKMNAILPLQIDTQDSATDYLRFFCASVHGDEGAFNIIDEIDQIHWLEAADRDRFESFIQVVLDKECTDPEEKKEDGNVFWSCRALCKHSNALFLADFRINASGVVKMQNDIPIITNLSANLEVFEDGLRTYIKKRPEKGKELEMPSFIYAAEKGLLGVMMWQLEQDENLNINDVTKCPKNKDSKNEEPNDKDVYGKTALRLATENVHIHVVVWLIGLEGIEDYKADDGKTAQNIANERKNKRLISLFQKFNQKPTT